MVKPTKFVIEIDVEGPEGRVAIEGDVDMATTARVDEAVAEALARGARRVTIDLTKAGFIDSSGLRALIELHGRAGADGWELAIRRPPEGPFTVFRVSGADQVLPFADD